MLKTILLAALFAGVLVAAEADAQCNVREEGERVALEIDRARAVVQRSGVREAAQLLEAAGKRLMEAKRRADNRQMELACANLRAAANLVHKAVEMASRSDVLWSELENQLGRTDDLLRDTAGVLRSCAAPETDRLMTTAMRQQEEAWRAFRTQRARMALKLTLTAREQTNRARRFCEGDAAGNAETVEAELAQTDRYLEEAARLLDERREGGAEAIRPASNLQDRAWESFREDRFLLALRMTRSARGLARNAVGDLDVAPQAEDVEALIETVSEQLVDLLEEAEERRDDQALRRLRQAGGLLEEARRLLDGGKVREALGSARTASALASDAEEALRESRE